MKKSMMISTGWVLTGVLLQWLVGDIRWEIFAFPVNVIVLCLYLLLLFVIYMLRKKVYFFRWMTSPSAAVGALIWVVLLTVVMGLIRQESSFPDDFDDGMFGLSRMLSSWYFVFAYVWMITILGSTAIKHTIPFRSRNIPFLLNHWGLFITVICATLGHADIQCLHMTLVLNHKENSAVDAMGRIYGLPFSVTLKKFTMEEYPPKLFLSNNADGNMLPNDRSQFISLERNVRQGTLRNWQIHIDRFIPSAAYIDAYDKQNGIHRRGWVSCGSYALPQQSLYLNSSVSLTMPQPEPKSFASVVKIDTGTGKEVEHVIKVNKPLDVAHWKIYQFGYDTDKGKWSDVSILELVYDSWLPFVYTGIAMMIVGAVCMFMQPRRRKGERSL